MLELSSSFISTNLNFHQVACCSQPKLHKAAAAAPFSGASSNSNRSCGSVTLSGTRNGLTRQRLRSSCSAVKRAEKGQLFSREAERNGPKVPWKLHFGAFGECWKLYFVIGGLVRSAFAGSVWSLWKGKTCDLCELAKWRWHVCYSCRSQEVMHIGWVRTP